MTDLYKQPENPNRFSEFMELVGVIGQAIIEKRQYSKSKPFIHAFRKGLEEHSESESAVPKLMTLINQFAKQKNPPWHVLQFPILDHEIGPLWATYPIKNYSILCECLHHPNACLTEQHRFDLMTHFFSLGCPVDPKPRALDEQSSLPLILLAARHGYNSIIDLLIEQGADRHVRDSQDHSALMFASSRNHTHTVRHLLAKGVRQINKCDQHGYTALAFAVSDSNLSICEALLEYGAKVNVAGEEVQYSALGQAIGSGNQQAFDLFIHHPSYTISPSETDQNQETLLHLAILRGQFPMAMRLMDHPDVNLDVQNAHGDTPLHFIAQAARDGNPAHYVPLTQMIIRFLENGANALLQNESGVSAHQLLQNAPMVYQVYHDFLLAKAEKEILQTELSQQSESVMDTSLNSVSPNAPKKPAPRL